MPKKIYISSTFGDLELYRAALQDTIRYLEGEKYFETVRTMEYMMPGIPEPVLTKCLQDVSDCDIYVLIIGKRYGSIEKTTNISYTENEYRHAVKEKKIIIPLIADDNASGLADIPIDNPKEYERFKTEIQSRYQTFIKNFTNAHHSSLQLVLALYKFAGKNRGVWDEIKYLCDRQSQYLQFIGNKQKEHLNIFTIIGKNTDRADYFAERMAKYEFGVPKQYQLSPLHSTTFIGNNISPEKHQQILITHLMQNYISISEDMPRTLADCFGVFKQKKIDNIFIKLYLGKEDKGNKTLEKTLESFFQKLSKECEKNKISIYYLVIFEFNENDTADGSISEWLLKNKKIKQKPANLYDINVLPLIKRTDVDTWVSTHIAGSDRYTTTNDEAINTLLSGYYNDKQDQNMQRTFSILTEVINIINQQNEKN